MKENIDLQSLVDFCKKVDLDFPIPLSEKVDILEYAEKLIRNASIKVYRNDGEIVAIIAGYIQNTVDNKSYISIVAVSKEFRGRGIGKNLVREFINECEEEGIELVHVYTHKTNKSAIKMYEQLGFKVDNETSGIRSNDIHFIKKLTNMNSKFKEALYITSPLLPKLDDLYLQLEEIWESKWVTNNGSKHKELEERLKKYLNVENLVLFNNGTSALELGLKALDLKGEVITTPFTFPATVQALDRNGLIPVFCDIDENTLNIDADKIEKLITNKTSAILAVHVFGNPCDVEKIQSIANRYNLKVIYDGAHAFGSYVKDTAVGQFGDMTMFSFHATKLFNTIEGGALTFRNKSLSKELSLLKNFGISSPESVVLSGTNAKLNEIQAAVGIEVLKLVEDERYKRKIIKETYEEELRDIEGIKILTKLDGLESSYQYLAIEVDKLKYGISRDELYEALKGYNVFARKYFYPLCSEFEWYKGLPSIGEINLPIAHKMVNRVLCMPYYGELNKNDIKKICNIIKIIRNRVVN